MYVCNILYMQCPTHTTHKHNNIYMATQYSRSNPIIFPPQRMASHATPEKLSLHLSVTDIRTHSVYNAYMALCVMSIRSKIIAWELFTCILLLL